MKSVSDIRPPAGPIEPRLNFTFYLAALISLSFVNLAPAQENEFAYVANVQVNQVSGFKIDPIAGGLTAVPGSPFTSATSGVTSVAIDQAGGFVYATNGFASDNNVAGFRIDPLSGRLTPVPGSPFATGAGPRSIAITGSGKFAYVANQGTNNVSAFTIEKQSGRLLPVPGSPFAAGSFPSWVAVDPSGQFVYVTNQSSNDVWGYQINPKNGALTAIAGSPFAAGTFPQSVVVEPLGRYVYVANEGSGNVSGYSIDPTTGALKLLGTFAAGAGGINGVSVDPAAKHVFVAGYGGIYEYSIVDASVCCAGPGSLTPVPGSPFGTGTNQVYGAWTPSSIAINFSDTLAYATSGPYYSGNATGFTVNNGALTQFAGATIPIGSGSVVIAISRPPTTPTYSAVAIPDGPFALRSITAAGINNEGQVTGSYFLDESEPLEFTFLYSMGTTGGGGGLGGHASMANGLNNKGQVVGQGDISPPVGNLIVLHQAYVFSNGTTVHLDTRSGGQSAAFSINQNGEITGSISTGNCGGILCYDPSLLGDTHAFMDTGSGLTDIGTLGGNFSEGIGINNLGEITGASNLVANGPNHVFLYYRGAMHDLGAFHGSDSLGKAINDNGQIIGTAGMSGFLYSGGAFHALPTLPGGTYSIPAGINKHGDVVGAGSVPGPSGAPTHAFLYKDGVMRDLNTLVDSSLTLLTSAAGINDKGQIVASGIDGQLYVLTPKP